MKKLFVLLYLLAGSMALAEPISTERQFYNHAGSYNVIDNPGCENGKSFWEPSDSDELDIRVNDPGFGARSCSWDPDSNSDTLDTASQTIPRGLAGQRCRASVNYLYSSGNDGDIALQVLQDGNSVLASNSLFRGSLWKRSQLDFICPPIGSSIELRFDSIIANPGSLFIDQAYLGQLDSTELFVTSSNPNDSINQSFNHNSRMRIEVARVDNSGGSTCSITSEFGNWLDGNPSENTTGYCTYNILPGIFDRPPACFCVSHEAGVSSNCSLIGPAGENTINVFTMDAAQNGADYEAYIMCVGVTKK